eukprot:438974_1
MWEMMNTIYIILFCTAYCVYGQSYCDNRNDGWCTNEFYASRNEYVTWLTATCSGTCFILWYDKKLIFLLILWYTTMILFIYVNNSALWFILLIIDLICYFALFGNSSSENNNDEYNILKPTFDNSALDPFGENIVSKLLYDIIEDRLIAKRDEGLTQKEINRKKLKKAANKLKKKECYFLFINKIKTNWKIIKNNLNIIKKSKNRVMNKYSETNMNSENEY